MITQMNDSEEQDTSHMTTNTEKPLIHKTAKRTNAAAMSVNTIELYHKVAKAIDLTELRAAVPLKGKPRLKNDDIMLILLKSVCCYNAYISERGKKDKPYQKGFQFFWQSVPDHITSTHNRPTVKSLCD